MTALDPHFEDLAGDWIDCPACAADPDCLVCDGAGGFLSADLPDPQHPCTLILREGAFA